MRITVELSFYPLVAAPIAKIESFIRELEGADGLELVVNQMSTQLVGEIGDVMAALETALGRAFAKGEPEVLVAKFLNAELAIGEPPDRSPDRAGAR